MADFDFNQVFVMGLPRSGSSLFSRLLNGSAHFFSINDLYYLQKVDEINGFNRTLTSVEIDLLFNYLIDVLHTRAFSNDDFIGGFRIGIADFDMVREDLRKEAHSLARWYDLVDYVLSGYANMLSADCWVDKTPQNFWFIDILDDAFRKPGYIFVMRHPYDVFSSLKYSNGEGHDRRRYNAYVYAHYWRKAVLAYKSKMKCSNALLVRYEDLLSQPDEQRIRLEEFFGVKLIPVEIDQLGNNSSFRNKPRRQITSFEKLVCNYVAKEEMESLGYTIEKVGLSVVDLLEFLVRSSVFVWFQSLRFLFESNGRKRIYRFLSIRF